MNPYPLRDRVADALRLRPMTAPQLATCLDASAWAVRSALGRLCKHGIATRAHREPSDTVGAPAYVYQRTDYVPHKRDQSSAIALLGPAARHAGRAANLITALVEREGAVMLVLTGREVYAVAPDSGRAQAITEHHPDWIVGTYDVGCSATRITADLRECAREAA